MTLKTSTALTGTLLAALMVAGSLVSVQAGEGCTKDKAKDGQSAAYPATQVDTALALVTRD